MSEDVRWRVFQLWLQGVSYRAIGPQVELSKSRVAQIVGEIVDQVHVREKKNVDAVKEATLDHEEFTESLVNDGALLYGEYEAFKEELESEMNRLRSEREKEENRLRRSKHMKAVLEILERRGIEARDLEFAWDWWLLQSRRSSQRVVPFVRSASSEGFP